MELLQRGLIRMWGGMVDAFVVSSTQDEKDLEGIRVLELEDIKTKDEDAFFIITPIHKKFSSILQGN